MSVSTVLGQPWETLFGSEKAVAAMELPRQDMAVLGRGPESDAAALMIECKICGNSVQPTAMLRHMQSHESPALDVNKLTGSSWDKLFPHSTHDQLPIDLTQNNYSNIHSQPLKDMIILGNVPENDAFSTIKCTLCDKRVMCAAAAQHLLKHDENIVNLKSKIVAKHKASLVEKTTSCDSSKAQAVNGRQAAGAANIRRIKEEFIVKQPLVPSLKVKIVKKASPPKKLTFNLDDERKSAKKKSKSPIPPQLEPILPNTKKVVLLNEPPQLSPALSKKSGKSVEQRPEKVYDPNKNCGVINDLGKPCLRSILCKVHLVSQKRAVLNRSQPYDAIVKQNKMSAEQVMKLQTAPVSAVPVVLAESACIELIEPIKKRVKTEESIFYDTASRIYMDICPTPPPIPVQVQTLKWEQSSISSPPTTIESNSWGQVLRWDESAPIQANCPPQLILDEAVGVPSLTPRPIATNTFGCRLVGGLLTKCKKLDAFRKHVKSVWGTPIGGGEKRKRAESVEDDLPASVLAPSSDVSRSILLSSRPDASRSLLLNSGGGVHPTPSPRSLLSTTSPASVSRTLLSPPSPINFIPLNEFNLVL